MIKKTDKKSESDNKISIYNILFGISFFSAIIVSLFQDKEELTYLMPVVILTILLKYLSITKTKAKPLYIGTLLIIMLSTFLSIYCFKSCFIWITILTSSSLICYSLLLIPYLYKNKLKPIASIYLLIGFIIVGFLLYLVVGLLINTMQAKNLFFVFLTVVCLLIYLVIASIIYIKDNYSNGILLLASGILTIIQHCFAPINEFFQYNKTFTVLIIISRVIAVYLFMIFIAKTEVSELSEDTIH